MKPSLILLLLAGCASSTSLKTIPQEWSTVPAARKIAAVTLDAEGKVTPGEVTKAAGTVRVEGSRLFNGEKALTDAFAAIDSFDVSESRGEVVFSARRDGGFDIGLVATDGSAVNWAPADPADEVAVQWAPRGNKASYVVRAPGGDVVRTLHIPTSFALTVPFSQATIHALAWDPQAERYAVVWSALDSSDRVEVVRYGGEERRTVIGPEQTLEVEIEPLGRDAMLVRPRELAYDERLPVVYWMAGGFGWNDALAALMRRSRVACVVTRRPPDDALRSAVGMLQWVDRERSWLVDPLGEAGTFPAASMRIIGEAGLPAGRYRVDGSVVAAAPAVVQSLAAGFIPDQLKRTTRTNGSSR